MEPSQSQVLRPALSPVGGNERIEALDVVRGFALIGILMMNVEFFNRATGNLGTGMPQGLTGADYVASFFVQYFVTGKFWTIFSLLFGMGFAVMLTRAERAGRDFLRPYMRRIAALAVFGACHNIFLWPGDILFSYAVAAVCLLVVLYGRPRYIAAAIGLALVGGVAPKLVALAGVPKDSLPDLGFLFGIAGGLGYFSFVAWWLRGEQRVRKFNVPTVGFVMLVLGIVGLLAGVVMWILPNVPREPRFGTPIFGFALTVLGLLTCKYHEPREERPWRLGVGVYVFSFFMMTATGAVSYLVPRPVTPAPAVASVKANQAKPAQAKPSPAEAAAKEAAERAKRLKERAEAIQKETRVASSGTYAEGVALRAPRFAEHAPGEIGFATILIGMFLLGFWFVKSGIMENTRAHLPLFRKLATVALPFGVGLGLLGALVAVRQIPGSNGADGYQFARGLLMLGNLPASLGYVGLVVVMLHSGSVFARIAVLAPFGRMALTNYLMQSLIGAIFFFGWGFGHFGMPRAQQMGYVACVIVAQVAFSHFWLARFRYGPMEWLWRAITYWTVPPMRLARPALTPVPVGAR